MKTQFINDLKDGHAVTSFFLVRVKEIRTSAKSNRSWLHLDLADRSGSIAAKMWDNFADLVELFDRDDIVKIRGRAKLYNDQIELTIEQIQPASEHEYDLADFLPHTKEDVEKLYARVRETAASVKNPWIRKLLASVVDDPAIEPKLKRAPAAMTMHHAFLGGLLEHVVSLLRLADRVAPHYPILHRDLLLTGVILHDIGKVRELAWDVGFEYTVEGQLLGHINMGVALVEKTIDSLPGFPSRLRTLVVHMILSHHGKLEFGSPKVPMIPEALVLNFVDDLDAKMQAVANEFAKCVREGKAADELTGKVWALDQRQLLSTWGWLGDPGIRDQGSGNREQ